MPVTWNTCVTWAWLAPDSPPRIANPIYREVVAAGVGLRVARTAWTYRWRGTWTTTPAGHDQAADGVRARSSGSTRSTGLDHLGDYREAGPQLILQAYLQRVVNGAAASSGSTGWDGAGRTCWCCGRGRRVSRWTCGSGSWSSARCCGTRPARASRGRSRGGEADVGVHGEVQGGGRASGGDRPPHRRGGTSGRRGRCDESGRRQDGRGVVVWTL